MRLSGLSGDAVAQVFERFSYVAPDSIPAFAGMVGGPDATIWVQRLAPIEGMRANSTLDALIPGGSSWDVFCQDGRFLGHVTLPSDFALTRIRGSHVYGVGVDESDVQRVVRSRLRTADGSGVTVSPCAAM